MADSIHCPACSGHDLQVVQQWRISAGYRVIGCRDCGLLFTHPQPSDELLHAYYGPDGGWQAARTDKAANAQTRTKGAASALMATLDRYFAASTAAMGARVLDFGCGTGTWLNSFQDCGWETFGIEPSTEVAFVRHRRLPAVPRDPEFDLVIAYHVLEHLPRPLDTLRELAQSIRPGGHCFVSVPRVDTLAVHRNFKYCLDPGHDHIVAYTETCLRGLLARSGLTVIAALHELDEAFTKGQPLRLRLLARKTATPVVEPDPISPLVAVLEALHDSVRRTTSKGEYANSALS